MAFTDHKLKFTIDADGKAARTELLDIDRLIGKVGSGLGGWAGPAAAVATGFAAVGASAAGAGLALFELTKHAADYGSTIFDASKKTGLHAEALSAMDFAAKQSGTSLEQITGGIAKFAKAVGAAADDTKKAAKFLEDFGITPQAALADLDGALGKVFKRIIDAPPGIERMTLAQKAFGKAGADLLPFIDSFDGDLGKLIKRAKDLGVTINDDAAAAADKFGDQLDELSSQLEGAGRTIGTAFMGPFTDMAKGVSNWLVQNKDEIARWGQQMGDTLTGLISYWNDYHKAVVGEGHKNEPYRLNPAGEKEYLGDTSSYFGIIGALVRDRGTRARMAAAPPAWTGNQFELDPVTNTLRARSAPFVPPGGYTAPSGGKHRPPKETDSEFRKFFEERGFHVNRTFGGEINKGSLHPSGQAADVRIQGKSVAEVFALTAAALEKGYRLFDERQKRAGVKQTGPHLHFEKGGSLKESGFLGAGMYGGPEQLAYLQMLDAQRLGKASGQSGFKAFLKDQAEDPSEVRAGLRQLADEMIAAEQQASDSRLSIRQKEADQAEEIIKGMVLNGQMTETEAVERVGQLRIDMILEEQRELQEQIPTAANLQRLEEIRLELDTERLKQANDKLQTEKEITAEINRQISSLKKANQRPGGLQKRESYQDRIQRMGATTVGSGQEIGAMGQLHDYFVSEGNTAAIAGVDALAQAFGGLGQAIGATVEAWVLYGSVGEGAQEVTAKILASIAQQAAIKAIFELAEGFAMLGLAFFGHPGAGPSATQHFIAAGMYGAIAGGAALMGRAVAGDSMKKGGSGGGRSSSSSSGGGQQQQVTPYSRQTDDVYISGHRNAATSVLARAVEKLEKKISAMNPGDVLVAGSRQRKGFIGTQAVDDMKTRPQLGTRLLRQANAR